MADALARLGNRLHTLPDGETGERKNWIIHIVESFRSHPDLAVAREGDWSDYERIPRFKVKAGRSFTSAGLDLGYAREFHKSYPTFKALREKSHRPDLAFQVGIPSDLDMTLFTFGPSGILSQRHVFTEATVRDIETIHREAGDDVVFQIEVPAELVFVAQMPPPLRPLVARYMAGGIRRLASQAPEGSRFGIHLCLGDMNHRALATLKDVGPVVQLANAIAARWPANRSLEYIHAPFAAANVPPTLDPGWYAPLANLRLPKWTRFIAGCVHEELGVEDQQAVLALIEEQVGHRVDVATACGLGRRTPKEATAAMERMGALA